MRQKGLSRDRQMLKAPANPLKQRDVDVLISGALERMLVIQAVQGTEEHLTAAQRFDYTTFLVVAILASTLSVRPQVLKELTRETLLWAEARGEWMIAVSCVNMKMKDPILLSLPRILSASLTWYMKHIVPEDRCGCVFSRFGAGFAERQDFTDIVRRGTTILLGRNDYTSRTLRPGIATIIAARSDYDERMERAATTAQNHSVAIHRTHYAHEDRLNMVRPLQDWLLRNVTTAGDAAAQQEEEEEKSNE
jgi:hypothetical protein